MIKNLNSHRRAFLGLILIAVGVVMIAFQAFGGLTQFLWPFFIIVPGAVLAAVALSTGGGARKLAIPGTTIAGVGLILLFQNTFDHYESWAYAWALIPFFVGVGMMLSAEEEAGEDGTEAGRHLITWALTVFLAMGAVFELFIFGGGGLFGARFLVPLLLIVAGAAVLLGWVSTHHEPHDSDQNT